MCPPDEQAAAPTTAGSAGGGPPGQAAAEASREFLSTKRVPPRVSDGLVLRSRLHHHLDECAAQCSVTVVTGPAGAGKTSLVADWARRRTGPTAWFTLGSVDNSRAAFWRQVVLAIAETGASPTLAQFALPAPAVLNELLAELLAELDQVDQPVVLVVDDAHLLTDPGVLADLDVLLRAPPDGLRLVLVGRAAPSLRLARLRVAGDLGEVTGEDLRFTQEESGELLKRSGVTLDDGGREHVWELSEGWGAGLSLCAMALKAGANPVGAVDRLRGRIDVISDYLLEEMFLELDPQAREFLLATSVVNAVCGDLADAITGGQGGGAVLHDLHARGALVQPVDEARVWYRYHGLLLDMLREQLRRVSADRIPLLHRRAAVWLSAHDLPVRAGRHAVAAGDAQLAARICAEHSAALQLSGRKGEMADVLRDLPPGALEQDPDLALTLAGAAAEASDVAEAIRWDRIAVDAAAAASPEVRAHVEARRTNVEVYLARLTGDVPRALQTIEMFPEPDTLLPADRDRYGLTLVNVGALEAWLGRRETAVERLSLGLDIATDHGRDYLRLAALAHRGLAHTWGGRLPEATRDATAALVIADAHGWRRTTLGATALLVLAVCALLRARLSEADTLLDEALEGMAHSAEVPLRLVTAATRARVARMRDDPTEAIETIASLRAQYRHSPFFTPLSEQLLAEEALALCAAGSEEQAIAMLESQMDARAGRASTVALARLLLARDPRRSIELAARQDAAPPDAALASVEMHALLVCARAHEALGERAAATAALDEALRLVEATGVWLPVLDQDGRLAPLLQAHRGKGSEFSALAGELSDRLAFHDASDPVVVDELSPRELSVLRYLPTMLTNREIAAELDVSVNTVKTHVKSIYLKVGARDRRDAVRRARRAGLMALAS